MRPVLHDDDEGKNHHADLNNLIEASRDDTLTLNVRQIPGHLEELLGVPPVKAPHRKPQHILYQYETGKIADDNLAAFTSLVESCLPTKNDSGQEEEQE